MRSAENSPRMGGHQPLTNLLYEPWMEHDSCGVGFVADSSGARSHRILRMALSCVENVTHRGAVSADAGTGDGAGVLTQIPFQLFEREVERLGQCIHDQSDLAVGMFFFPRNPIRLTRSLEIAEEAVEEYQLDFLGWREVPVDPSALGKQAVQSQPEIRQVLLSRPGLMSEDTFERRLYLIRKSIEKHAAAEGLSDLYVSSLSNQTIVYKGLMVASQLPGFYLDLQDSGFETAIAMFHQRYSTNTFPSWELAQPFRYLGHNGEINTIQGNRNWMSSREPELRSPVWRETVEEMRPLVSQVGSDSLSLDNGAGGPQGIRARPDPRCYDADPRGVGEHAPHARRSPRLLPLSLLPLRALGRSCGHYFFRWRDRRRHPRPERPPPRPIYRHDRRCGGHGVGDGSGRDR